MQSPNKILLVEDDRALAELICEYLGNEGYCVKHLNDGSLLESSIAQFEPTLIILDIMLPGKDGFTLCREIRPLYTGFIMVFTAREDEIDQIVGLELGADDYLIKPVKPRLLLAKIKSVFRRLTEQDQAISAAANLEFGQLAIDLNNRLVCLHGETINLTSAEFELLAVLANNAGQILSRDAITQALSGAYHDGLDRKIDNKISQLRKKLGDDASQPQRIKTVRSKGYLFVVNAWAD